MSPSTVPVFVTSVLAAVAGFGLFLHGAGRHADGMASKHWPATIGSVIESRCRRPSPDLRTSRTPS